MDKGPSFTPVGIDQSITKHALCLVASKNGRDHVSGTAMFIGSHLAVTAKHVLDDYKDQFGEHNKKHLDLSITAHQFIDGGRKHIRWFVEQTYTTSVTDIAFLKLIPETQQGLLARKGFIQLDLLPPETGTTVAAFGYFDCSADRTSENGLQLKLATTTGIVEEVHPVFRDRCLMPFPCFRVNARFDGGMSGGPVFDNTKGHLCGVICSSFMEGESRDGFTSYAATLWPSMGVRINIDRAGFPSGEWYPVWDLAKSKLIHALNWERVTVSLLNNNQHTVSLQPDKIRL